jgi:DNA-binding NarL/FixJ family response regulator
MEKKNEQILQVMLVDDHTPTRQEMRALINRQQDMVVSGESATGEAAVEDARRLHPDVVIMDIALPGITGVEAMKTIIRDLPQTKIVALSNHSGRILVQAILNAGGMGYVRKDRAFEELIPAIHTVSDGEKFMGRHIND